MKKGLILKSKKGMTLIELLVVLAIFFIMSAVTIFDYNSFKSNASLQNLSNEISLSIRKAQTYAVGVGGISGRFDEGYGVCFSKNEDYNKVFAIYSGDIDSFNEDYLSSDCEESSSSCMEILSIKSDEEVTGFYVNDSLDEDIEFLNIYFLRPNPEAIFYSNQGEMSVQSIGVLITNAGTGKSKIIKVSNTGQISVE